MLNVGIPAGLRPSPRFLFSLKVNLSKEHCKCAFLFGSLLRSRSISLEVHFCVSIVCVHRAGRRPLVGSWELFGQYVRTSYMHSFRHVQFLLWPILLEASCKVAHSDSSLFSFKAIKSWLWPSSILSIHDIINPLLSLTSILSGSNRTPEASYLIHS